jgi:alkylation response protein AidB-like acyl-CoA dehydrogenase
MTAYQAPLADMRFNLRYMAGLPELAGMPGLEESTPETVDAVLAEAAKFANEVLDPLNQVGDQQGCRLENEGVRMPEGFAAAYKSFSEAGWNSVAFDNAYGGQNMPWCVSVALQEMWAAANFSFSTCPMLTQGAIELLQTHGSPQQKEFLLPPLIQGKWTGTMNLTEAQAGSDLGSIKTRAEPDGEPGRYRILGQKIFITFGDHDMAENIVHLVLARVPGAPEGSKGISLFIVPKFLLNPDGTPGERNDVRPIGIEHKLGIRASPTCAMAFGENGGAFGSLVGAENHGLEYMFTMMNNARLSVGVEGLAIAERAYQRARAYATHRIQGAVAGHNAAQLMPILYHPDVRQMLLTMRSQIEAARSLIYFTAGQLDRAKRHPNEAERDRHRAIASFLVPIAKAWTTDLGTEVASLGVQVHGGVGYVEATGAAQHMRDARIASIYEGTNGIQAIDLVSRKLLRDNGQVARHLISEMEPTVKSISARSDPASAAIGNRLGEALGHIKATTQHLLATSSQNKALGLAGASAYLALFGTTLGGWLLARAAGTAALSIATGRGDLDFLKSKLSVAHYYAESVLPHGAGYAGQVIGGAQALMGLPPENV